MNSVIDDNVALTSSQTAARKGLGLETTNQRSVSSVLTKTSGINPQQIADAGQQVCQETQQAPIHSCIDHIALLLSCLSGVMPVQPYACNLLQLA